MTRDEIMALEAGPYLNALIEKHIYHRPGTLPTKEDIAQGDAWFWYPHHAMNIADSWKLVNYLCETRNLYFRLHRTPDYVWAGFDRWSESRLSVEAQADTFYLAVARAALLLEVDDD